MKITVTLEKDEFEPVLIKLLSKVMRQELSPEEVKTINFSTYYGTAREMTATIELFQPEAVEPALLCPSDDFVQNPVDSTMEVHPLEGTGE
jgi:hypothetical protein